MTAKFEYHYRDDIADHGQFKFLRTGVEYGHDGIKGLKHYIPIAQGALIGQQVSGAWTFAYRRDATDQRTPFEATCVSDGTAEISLRLRLPLDFGSFPENSLELAVSKSFNVAVLSATLYKNGAADSTINGSAIEPASTEIWEVFQLTPGGTYGRGDWITLVLTVTAINGDSVEFSDISLCYKTARGNAY